MNTGNVGIGTTGPSALLNLKGTLTSALTGTVAVTNLSATVTGTLTVFTTELAVGDSIKIGTEIFTVSAIASATSLTLDSAYQGTTASGLTAYRDPTLLAIDNGDAVNKLTVTRSGNVGIGTTGPTTALSFGSDVMISRATSDGSDTSYLAIGGGGTYSTTRGGIVTAYGNEHINYPGYVTLFGGATASGGHINFYTQDIERMRITYAGNVGIGTTAPAHKLDVSGAMYSRRYAKTYAATIAVDWNNGNVQSVTLTGNTIFTFSNGQDGGKYILIIKQDAIGSRTVAWPATVRWPGGEGPTLTTTANKTDYIGFIYNGIDSKYDGVAWRLNY